jgi:hypothetical protein
MLRSSTNSYKNVTGPVHSVGRASRPSDQPAFRGWRQEIQSRRHKGHEEEQPEEENARFIKMLDAVAYSFVLVLGEALRVFAPSWLNFLR